MDAVALVSQLAPYAYAALAAALLTYAWKARPFGPGSWRRTSGRVLSTTIEPGLVPLGDAPTRGHLVHVTFEYEVGDAEYEATAVAARVLTKVGAEDVVAQRWQPGRTVDVWHHPDEPARASLASPTTPAAVFCLVAGVVALACSIALALDRS